MKNENIISKDNTLASPNRKIHNIFLKILMTFSYLLEHIMKKVIYWL